MKKYNLYNNLLGWACFVVAAITYLLTIEPTASFWDCPEFISQGAKLEVGHPPGNPIFMLTARFFVTIFGNDLSKAAVAVNSMSALLSAATILLLFWTITHLIKRLIVRDDAREISLWQMALIFGGGLCGALAYTWSDTFWFSAVEGEVYAFSSFCTALVFWLILKWENRADQPHSDRYLILIAYVIGVSIAVHLLNLLCIPAIVLVYYFKKAKKVTALKALMALGLSFVIVGLILYGLVPGFVKVAQWFELFFVNGLGFSYNMGVLFYAILLVAVFVWAIIALRQQKSKSAIKTSFFFSIALSGMLFIEAWWIGLLLISGLAVYLAFFCKVVPVRVFNVIILSVTLIFVGYSSYALLLIRSHANTPMNQNAPDNVFALGSYLNREQYGDRPLFYGGVIGESLVTYTVQTRDGFIVEVVQVDEQGIPMTEPLDGILRNENGEAYNNPSTTYTKVVKSSPDEGDKYVEGMPKPEYAELPDMKMLFPRMYSNMPEHVAGYKYWSGFELPDFKKVIPADVREKWALQGYALLDDVKPYLTSVTSVVTHIDGDGNPVEMIDHGQDVELIRPKTVFKPSFMDNLRYFFNYQFSHMYWRYFMWNFAGRQNDFQGNGEPHLGNWISGIPFIDNARLGDQSLLPDEFGKGNKGHNVFYMLPLLLGIIGLLWQALYIKKDAPQRGIEQFWVICFLFIMTGIAIVFYLNQYPYQPRERDYAFAGSFYAFAIWIGIGVPAIGTILRAILSPKSKGAAKKAEKANPTSTTTENETASTPAEDVDARNPKESPTPRAALIVSATIAVAIGLIVPIQMVSQTWDDHDRSGRYTARDFGFNYLSSVEPNGIIFCNGDNDTFPLWYAQEVEGYRTDVRVVNLSYLTTDWYANQQRIPSYDGAPVEMYATPATYAYDRLAMSLINPRADTLVTAKDALNDLYVSMDKYKYPYPVMMYPNIYMPVNERAAIKAFNINPSDSLTAPYIIPYIDDIQLNVAQSRQQMGLGNTLTLDIISNSVENGFKRPVYFASTVPESSYFKIRGRSAGLEPYLSSTGMAYQVTPFRSPQLSPTLDKAYENIMGKFRWGGLDGPHPEKLYLDETVRRMVATTRLSIYSAANELINFGDLPATQWAKDHARKNGYDVPATRGDMGRILLKTIQTKLPSAATPFEGILPVYMAESFYDLYLQSHNPADLDAAEALLKESMPRYSELLRYGASLNPERFVSFYNSDPNAFKYLGVAVGLQNRINVLRGLEKNRDAEGVAELIEYWAPRSNFDDTVTSIIYVNGYTEDEIISNLQESEDLDSNIAYALQYALLTLDAHKAAGVSPTEVGETWLKKYGLKKEQWQNLSQFYPEN